MWQLNQPITTLTNGPLQLKVNYARPADGLFDVQFDGRSLPAARLLQVRTPHHAPADCEETVTDVYTRGPDLVATYAQTDQRTVRPQVYWRAIRLDSTDEPIYGIDLIVSMQTSLMDSDPSMTIHTDVGAAEAWQRSAAETERFRHVNGDSVSGADGDAARHLIVARHTIGTYGYAEMIHPSDFAGGELTWSEDESRLEISTRIFDQRLEKGVIRRGHLRGVFVPRTGDFQSANRALTDLSASSPTLTT